VPFILLNCIAVRDGTDVVPRYMIQQQQLSVYPFRSTMMYRIIFFIALTLVISNHIGCKAASNKGVKPNTETEEKQEIREEELRPEDINPERSDNNTYIAQYAYLDESEEEDSYDYDSYDEEYSYDNDPETQEAEDSTGKTSDESSTNESELIDENVSPNENIDKETNSDDWGNYSDDDYPVYEDSSSNY
jgi:hypothetical protein